jgi:hypothetical protein
MSSTATLVSEAKRLAADLTTKSVFDLSSDLPIVADVLLKSANALQSLDARITALEKGKSK